MGYAKIPNLYKGQEILMFKRCFALEKIHGTSAHFRYKDGQLTFSPGGASHSQFVACFDVSALEEKCAALGLPDFKVHGEAYGGKMQGMSKTYGPDLKFVCFDVKIDDRWISVPQAERFCNNLGLEFVHYVEIDTDIALIDQQRDAFSI